MSSVEPDVGVAKKRRGPSMADVAREAGVSMQTVSRVSTGRNPVEQQKRARVLEAMNKLGYRPNSAARALQSGQFRNLGVMMFTLASFGNMRTVDAISVAAAAAGYSITLIPVAHPAQKDVTVAFSRLAERAVDGVIIIMEAHLIDEAEIEIPPGLPVVVVDSSAGGVYPVIDTDQAQGARLATEHLLELGHTNIWHVSGPEGSYSAERRRESWKATLEAHGITPPPVCFGDWSVESGYEAGKQLAARSDVTAIFAGNDQMALGVLRALHEAGRNVPGEISVVGFDDMEGASGYWPPLTTIHQEFSEVGRLSVGSLLHEIESGPQPLGSSLVPTNLVLRSSTARVSTGQAPRA